MAKKSTKKDEVVKVENEVQDKAMHHDPNVYGYAEGGKAPFEGNLILWAMNLARQVAAKETTMSFEMSDSFEQTRQTGKEVITDLGLQALRLIELLTQGHLENIDEGLALHQDVLTGKVAKETPVFEMKKVETED